MELSRNGTGKYTMMDSMLSYSRLTAIICGVTGDGTGALPDQDSALVGDGLLHGITVAGTLHTGMVVTGVAIGEVTMAVTGVVTGDLPGIITIIIRTGQATTVSDIQTTARQDIQDILLPDAVRQDLVIPADIQLAHEEGLQVV